MFTLYGLGVGLILTLFVTTPLTLILARALEVRQFGIAVTVLDILLRGLTFFLVFVLALNRLPFGPYRLRLVRKNRDTTEVFA